MATRPQQPLRALRHRPASALGQELDPRPAVEGEAHGQRQPAELRANRGVERLSPDHPRRRSFGVRVVLERGRREELRVVLGRAIGHELLRRLVRPEADDALERRVAIALPGPPVRVVKQPPGPGHQPPLVGPREGDPSGRSPSGAAHGQADRGGRPVRRDQGDLGLRVRAAAVGVGHRGHPGRVGAGDGRDVGEALGGAERVLVERDFGEAGVRESCGQRWAGHGCAVGRRRAGGRAAPHGPQLRPVAVQREQLGAVVGDLLAVGGLERVSLKDLVRDRVDHAGLRRLGRRDVGGLGVLGGPADKCRLVDRARVGLHVAYAPALGPIDRSQARTVPVQVKGARSLAQGVLGPDPAEPAVVRAVAGGGEHRAEGVRGFLGRRVGGHHLAVLEATQRGPRADAGPARLAHDPELGRTGDRDASRVARAAADGGERAPLDSVVGVEPPWDRVVALDREDAAVGGEELQVSGRPEWHLERRAGGRRRLLEAPGRGRTGRRRGEHGRRQAEEQCRSGPPAERPPTHRPAASLARGGIGAQPCRFPR